MCLLIICLSFDKFILLLEWSVEVEDEMFMSEGVLDMSAVIRLATMAES